MVALARRRQGFGLSGDESPALFRHSYTSVLSGSSLRHDRDMALIFGMLLILSEMNVGDDEC